MTAAEQRSVMLGMSWATGEPLARVRRPEQPLAEPEPLRGLSLAYEVPDGGPRHCIGHSGARSRDEPLDCPNKPEAGSRTCTSCSVKDAMYASSLHHAHTRARAAIDPDVAEHLRQPNRLYLAAFRDGSIKVGTSTAARAETRLLEQGAWVARFVATTTDGYSVRDLEDRITIDVGLTQAVAIGRKLDGLAQPRVDQWLHEQLDIWTAAAHDVLAVMQDPRLTAVEEPWLNPAAEADVWRSVHRYPQPLDRGSHVLDIVDVCGRAIAFRRHRGDDVFVADLRSLFGVEFGPLEAEPEAVAVQDALF